MVSVPPSLLNAHQARRHHLSQVPAARLRRHVAGPGQFRGGEHAPVHQLQQHRRARGFPHQGCDSGKVVGVHGVAFDG